MQSLCCFSKNKNMSCCKDCADKQNDNMNALRKYGFGRSQGDVGFECPTGFDMNSNGECIPARQVPLEPPTNTPMDTSTGGAYSMYGRKLPKPKNNIGRCAGIVAPQGYMIIETANGCAQVVNYDANIVGQPTTANNPIQSLINAVTGNSSGETTSGGLSGIFENKGLIVAAVIVGGFYFLGKGRKTPKSYSTTTDTKY